MKKYDRAAREYVTEEEYNRRYSKREGCKGGKMHDFVLVVPPQYRMDGSLGMDVAEKFYEAEDTLLSKEDAAEKEFTAALEKIGLNESKYGRWKSSRNRYYICLRCRKQKWM